MKEEGYHTVFINSEPNNKTFTQYLEILDFDELISEKKETYQGYSGTLSDKESYELLWDTIEKNESIEMPYLIGIYTYGTHVSLDSIDEKYGDGKNTELNKFFDVDYQFGEFMRKFNEADFTDDTIVIFTADHCTYYDDVFKYTFPEYYRKEVFFDRIPLFIYYKGIKPREIDADGRTSVNIAPTILDYIDVSRENYFLGDSLFRRTGDNRFFDGVYFHFYRII